MAFFGNVLSLLIGFLVSESLVGCFGEEITTPGYDCRTSVNVCSCQDESSNTVECSNIDTEEEAKCARQYLRQLRVKANFTELVFYNSKLEIIPEDFLRSHPLKLLALFDGLSPRIPRDLKTPVCGTLDSLFWKFRDGLRTIGEKAFGKCPVLKYLFLNRYNIEKVSSGAFIGLSNLKTLDFSFNDITTIEGLEGIPRLKTLSFYHNYVSYVAKNAFQNLSNLQSIDLRYNELTTLEEGTFDPLTDLTSVDLSRNPLNCDCSLKWLQDWSKSHNVDTRAECGPEKIPLHNMDLSYCFAATTGKATRDLTDNVSTGQSSKNSATDTIVFVSVFTLALKLFDVLCD